LLGSAWLMQMGSTLKATAIMAAQIATYLVVFHRSAEGGCFGCVRED
jgi:hypothetical protein